MTVEALEVILAFNKVLAILKEKLNLDEPRLKCIEDEFYRTAGAMVADMAWDREEAERKRSLPPPEHPRRGRRHEPRTKKKSLPMVRESYKSRGRLAQMLLVRMDQQAARPRGVRAASPCAADAARGDDGQAQDKDPPAS